tara:strand:- start:632 stop:1021 length:390 start_codon:yes stop_codon:yes gene_type:complete
MALSNLNKDNLGRLFEMININNNEEKNYNNILSIKSNNSAYSRLELIAKQIDFLKNEALNILENHDFTHDLNNIKCNFRKVPGTYYYLYENEKNEKSLSLIGPNEWCNYYKFLSKLYYDYDYQFYRVEL